MNDPRLAHRLAQHRTVAAWLHYQVGAEKRASEKLQAAGEQVRAEQHATVVAYLEYLLKGERDTIGQLETQQAELGPIRFKLQPRTTTLPPHLHRADCWMAPTGGSTYDAHRARLAMNDAVLKVRACDACDPIPAIEEAERTGTASMDGP
ncbi:DUF6233 domain-containing protein [Streptomyces sp. cg28]|uniref:DUF6233 domain-containing protein n=1 Tax=Streptomyces sp. cg28 TaxID=3403457 RepID=UPI003B225D7A